METEWNLPESDHRLHLVTGRAGQLLPMIIKEIGKRHEQGLPCVLMVPQQYTLEAERTLVRELHLPGLIDIEVLSPARLMRRIRETVGTGDLQPLDERGRCMAISCALAERKDMLEYYAGTADQTGLTSRMSALLGDLQRSGLTPELLLQAASEHTGAAAKKEHDIALVWQAYEEILAGRFADIHRQTADAAAMLPASGVLNGISLFVYGFDLLQPGMCVLLAESLRSVRLAVVTMIMDDQAQDKRIFAGQTLSAQELSERLADRGMHMVRHRLIAAPIGRDPALVHLESALFTWKHPPFAGNQDAIAIHMAANPYQEARRAAEQLLAWHAEGISWDAMAVTLAVSGTSLDGILEETFRAARIPYYAARKDQAIRHGLCRMLLGGVRAATDRFDTKDVMTYVSSGFAGFDAVEAAELKNAAEAKGLRRNKWLKPIVFEAGDAAGEHLEELRRRAIEPLEKLHNDLKQAESAAQAAEAVYRLLEENHAYELLQEQEDALLAHDLPAEASRSRQVWKLCLDLLDELYSLLGSRKVKPELVCRLLEAGLTGMEISALPPEPDTVTIGEVGHLMTGKLRVMIIMGMQATEAGASTTSLLTERERAELSRSMKRQIGLTQNVQNAMHQADLYRTMALPSDRLLLTFSAGDQAGGVLMPSGLIADIRQMFSLETTGTALEEDDRTLPPSPQLMLDELGCQLRSDSEEELPDQEWLNAMRWMWASPIWRDKTAHVLDMLSAKNKVGPLLPGLAEKIFTAESTTISRLERYAECPYRHFLDYGLRLAQQEHYSFDASDQGNFYHEVLERFATMAGNAWPQLDDDQIECLLDQAIEEAQRSWENGPLLEDGIGQIQGAEALRKVKNTVRICTRQLSNADFIPIHAEAVFGSASEDGLPGVVLTLSSGQRISLRGKIDRIDQYNSKNSGVYIRVTDYKSSSHDVDIAKLWHGLQLQLMLYLCAASDGLKAEPAGALYMRIQDPTTDVERGKESEIDKPLCKAMQLKGYILAEQEIVEAMDRGEKMQSIQKVFNKDRSISKSAHGVDRRGMKGLMTHAKLKATELAETTRSGEISPSPARLNTWSACDFCTDKEACPRGKFRDLDKEKSEVLLERMAVEAEGKL